MPQKEICVLFIWQPEKKLRTYLEKGLSEYPVHCIFPPDTAEETFLELAPQADIIVGWRPTKKLLLAAEQLTLYINPGAGVQHLVNLFKEITRERPVILVNGHGNAYFTAQHAVALLLALTNRIIPHHNWMVQGEWRKGDADAISIPLRNRKVGLLGYGHVNRQVHRFLSGFDIEFAAVRQDWGKQVEPVPTPLKRYGYTEIHPFLEKIDTLIISVPLTSLTKNFIKMKELELLGKGGLLVNVARGPVIEESSLYTALKDKKIAGAALDVWYNYSPDPDEKGRKYPCTYPFHELDNIILSPHRAASPLNNLKRWDEVIENIRRVSRGEKEFLNVVNLEKEY